MLGGELEFRSRLYEEYDSGKDDFTSGSGVASPSPTKPPTMLMCPTDALCLVRVSFWEVYTVQIS